MAIKESVRTGGRSARVQASIHQAVRDLLQEHERANLSVPMIAARAGVTPSTIYRRWGDLTHLLADAAMEHVRPDAPIDQGNLRDDLLVWSELYLEDISSTPGREMLHDVIASSACSGKCVAIVRGQLEVILERAQARGEACPEAEDLIDGVVAPIIYRILYTGNAPTLARVQGWVERCLG